MKRYFIVEEFFGIKVYDSKLKKEYYFDKNDAVNIKKMLSGEFNYINNNVKENQLSVPLKISMNMNKECNLLFLPACIQCFSNSRTSRGIT